MQAKSDKNRRRVNFCIAIVFRFFKIQAGKPAGSNVVNIKIRIIVFAGK
jgi:hypothetical protein